MLSLTEKQIKVVSKAMNSFPYFVENIFSASFENFVGGEHVVNTAEFLEDNDWSVRISAKGHFKTTSCQAYAMWQILKEADSSVDKEAHYFSYTGTMAGYHINKLKGYIKKNPYFVDLEDLKPRAETKIKYSWKGNPYNFSINPQGLMEFKRGLHCNWGVFVDDPFQDPENKVEPNKIYKINKIMRTQILDIPNPGAFFHIVGTAQTREDFFFDDTFTSRFAKKVLPAFTNIKYDKRDRVIDGEPLWEEWMDRDELLQKQAERGKKIFAQEYLCKPYYSENTFVSDKDLAQASILSVHKTYSEMNEKEQEKYLDYNIIAGYDLGKKVHPAYIAVYKVKNDDWIQMYFRFFDGVDYTKQLQEAERLIDEYQIDRVYYDDTRNELELYREKGELPMEFEPKVLSSKSRVAVSNLLDTKFTTDKIKLIADKRQKTSFKSVMNDLTTIENQAGHGEAFWGTCLALFEETEARPAIM